MTVLCVPHSLRRGTLNYECYLFYRESCWWGARWKVEKWLADLCHFQFPRIFELIGKEFLFELADFERATLWELILKDSVHHSRRQRDWCRLTYCWHVPNPHACQDVERHQSSFQIFKLRACGRLWVLQFEKK